MSQTSSWDQAQLDLTGHPGWLHTNRVAPAVFRTAVEHGRTIAAAVETGTRPPNEGERLLDHAPKPGEA